MRFERFFGASRARVLALTQTCVLGACAANEAQPTCPDSAQAMALRGNEEATPSPDSTIAQTESREQAVANTELVALEDAELTAALEAALADAEELDLALDRASRELASEKGGKGDARSAIADALHAEQARTREGRRRLEEFRQLSKRLGSVLEREGIDLRLDRNLLSLELQADLLFDGGSAVLTPSGERILEEIARALSKMRRLEMMAEGHTDSVVVRTSRYRDNREFSFARAQAVASRLERLVPGLRLGAAGFGETRPVGENGTDAGRRANRRIELVFVPSFAWLPGAEFLREAVGEREP